MVKEYWKTIKDFPNYEISSWGNIINKKTRRILKGSLTKKGYIQVCLRANNTQSVKLVHRLVAEAFIDNPDNLPQINHKDENKTNNHISNLEYCNNKYNVNYGTRNKRASLKLNKIIVQYSLDGRFIKEWSSIKETGETLNIDRSDISNCCNNKLKSAGGFVWRKK